MTPEQIIASGITLKRVTFQDIGLNEPFMVADGDDFFDEWAVKIDEVRFIEIGRSPAVYPEEWMTFYVR